MTWHVEIMPDRSFCSLCAALSCVARRSRFAGSLSRRAPRRVSSSGRGPLPGRRPQAGSASQAQRSRHARRGGIRISVARFLRSSMARDGMNRSRMWCRCLLWVAVLGIALGTLGRSSRPLWAFSQPDLRRDSTEQIEGEIVAPPERAVRRASPEAAKSRAMRARSRTAPRVAAFVADLRPIRPRPPEPPAFVHPRPFRLLN